MIGVLGHQRSVRRTIETARPRLYRLAWSWCNDADEANDLVQEACLRAMERSAQLKDRTRAEHWITRIMSNLFLDRVRARRDYLDLAEVELAAGDADPLEAAERCDAVARVRGAVRGLGVDQRMVVTLVDLMEFSYAEVSDTLEIPVGTVMSRLCRARRRLREQLLETRRDEGGTGRLRLVR